MMTSENNWKKDWRCVETTEKHVNNRETGEKQIDRTKKQLEKCKKSGRKKKHIEKTSLPLAYLPLIRRSKKESFVNPGLLSGDNRWQQSFEGNARRATWHLSIHSPSYIHLE